MAQSCPASPDLSTALEGEPLPRAWLPLLLGTLVFSTLSILGAVSSRGFLEADGCTHFLFARFAFAEPHYLVNVWGRPFCTALYALGASLGDRQTGLIATRLISLMLTLAIALIACRIAAQQGYRYPVLAFLFVLAQPLLFLHSFSELTEVPFAFLLALAFGAYQSRQFLAMALLAALMPLARPEGFGFLLLAAMALLVHRRWTWLLLLPVPLLLWNHAGWVVYGEAGPWWRWLIGQWPYAADSLYARGYLFHFLALLPMLVGPAIFPALWLGLWQSLRPLNSALQSQNPRSLLRLSHRQRVQLLIAIIPLLVLIGHSLLYWRGKMASNGELRYLLVVAPFWALLCAEGWEWAFARMNWRRPILWAGIAALVPVLSHLYYPVVPLKMGADWQEAERIAHWYQSSGIADDYPNLTASHPAIWYYLDRSPSGANTCEWHQRTVARAPRGTLLIWDSVYGVFNSDAGRSVSPDSVRGAGWVWDRRGLVGALGFEQVFRTPFEPSGWHVFLSPRDVHGRPVDIDLWTRADGSDQATVTIGSSADPVEDIPNQTTWRTTRGLQLNELPVRMVPPRR